MSKNNLCYFASRSGRRFSSGGGNGGLTRGQVISMDSSSITLKLGSDSGSKIVLYTSSTPIQKMAQGKISDIQTGSNIMVRGSTNSDGSITASSMQMIPSSTVGF